jgi:hypothetical protein
MGIAERLGDREKFATIREALLFRRLRENSNNIVTMDGGALIRHIGDHFLRGSPNLAACEPRPQKSGRQETFGGRRGNRSRRACLEVRPPG